MNKQNVNMKKIYEDKARILEAAPEMLDVLRTLMDRSDYLNDEDYDLIKSAIMKATGVNCEMF